MPCSASLSFLLSFAVLHLPVVPQQHWLFAGRAFLSGNVQHHLKGKYEIIMTISPDGKVVTEKKQIPTSKQ
jgi:hypothetical protein